MALLTRTILFLSILSISLAPTLYAGGANGKEFGSLYTQLTYSPISTDIYFDSKGDEQSGIPFHRHQIENYGEIGVYQDQTTLVWNFTYASQTLGESKSATGLGPTMIGIHHQYFRGASIKLGSGFSTTLASPQNTSTNPLSNKNTPFTFSHFLKWERYEANFHYHSEIEENKNQAIQFDLRSTWQPIPQLYLSTTVRGQKNLQTSHTTKARQPGILVGHSLQTEYIAPGIEAFYSITPHWHTVGAFYGGWQMKNIFAAPGLKIGVAWTP